MARGLHQEEARAAKMQQTATQPMTARDRVPQPLGPAVCASCDSDTSGLVFGNDPDGFVLCLECLSPVFYCDLGGQG